MIELGTSLGAMEQDAALYEERNFEARGEAIDLLEYHFMDRIEELFYAGGDRAVLLALQARVSAALARLKGVDDLLFDRLRAELLAGGGLAGRGLAGGGLAGEPREAEPWGEGSRGVEPLEEGPLRSFRGTVLAYCDVAATGEIGYDVLDVFVNRLFAFRAMPMLTLTPEPEMVYFQKTPARIVFELVEKAGFKPGDVFFDLGSGLGQVVMLVHLLAGVMSVGVEFEPAFVAYARERTEELGLSGVIFVSRDARYADYSTGTVFFMYTPFVGDMLREVLALLRREASSRRIKVITYGPCVAEVILQDWLEPVELTRDVDPYRLVVFESNYT